MKNIKYKTSEIREYYAFNRRTWDEFYKSEREIVSRVMRLAGSDISILDVGCAAGGLGFALNDHFNVINYIGLDINKSVIEYAKRQDVPVGGKFRFIHGDIADRSLFSECEIFDLVISFGCVDWNVNFRKSLEACWALVKPGGYFISSIRLTPEPGINDIKNSYQYILFSGTGPKEDVEKANYIVVNIFDALRLLSEFKPANIDVYGYWGEPSGTAVTPYDRIVFSVFAVKKCEEGTSLEPSLRLDLPVNALGISGE
jgi:SAM-dependent methyltransferase